MRSLVLCDTFASVPDPTEPIRVREEHLAAVPMVQFSHEYRAEVLKQPMPPTRLTQLDAVLARCTRAAHAETTRAIFMSNAEGMLHSVKVPTLVLIGEPDDHTPLAFAQHLPTSISGAQLQVIPGLATCQIWTIRILSMRRPKLPRCSTPDRIPAWSPIPYVRILKRGGGRIALTPLEKQEDPVGLAALKTEIGRRWPMTRLLDMLKEADLRIDFTNAFRTVTDHENLSRTALQERQLLCLNGIGTNTGLKRMAAGQDDVTYRDLLYVRRRFMTRESMREAIAQVVNATLRARHPGIWGEGTTACAAGCGVMIYWYVERHSTCIYSQLKTPSSSEVASMIEGVLRHCTETEVQKAYVDSHGQSDVAFAFCRPLGFHLLPRLKRIHAQRLYRPIVGEPDTCPGLRAVLSRPIDGDPIRRQYNEMVKFATPLRLGTAAAADILRRFTRANLQHPRYRALVELGKALRTTFLCRYLHRIELRREIHEGLNAIES